MIAASYTCLRFNLHTRWVPCRSWCTTHDLAFEAPNQCRPGQQQRRDTQYGLDRREVGDRTRVTKCEQGYFIAHRATDRKPGEKPTDHTGFAVTVLCRWLRIRCANIRGR